jgi:hypothetical protein
MNTRVWTPITEADDAEFFRPADTEEPTTWEVAIPPFGKRQAQVVTAVWGFAYGCPEHRFWALAPQLKTLPEEGWPANVTLAVGPITTQAEADEAIPALLAVKAARHEAVFAPTEAIWLHEGIESWCEKCDWATGEGDNAIEGHLCPACVETDPQEVPRQLSVVRVRGGAPEHVASLREQCEAAGVEFVEETEGRLFQPSKEFPWGWECPNEVPSDEPPKEVVTHTTRNGKGRVARVLRRKAAGGGGVMDLSPQDTYQVWWGYQTSEAPEGDGEWREVEAEDPAQAARWFVDDLIRSGEVSHDDVLKVFVRGHGSWLFRFVAEVRVASVEKA